MTTKVKFSAGRNIAMKVPPHQYEATLRFYRDVVGLPVISGPAQSVGFEFGSNNLWIHWVAGISQAETWFELTTDDLSAAGEHFETTGVVRCDDIEPLPEGFQAFWISSPASIIHLVCKDSESWL